jgi:dolichol-phosphate mannosyltransferase
MHALIVIPTYNEIENIQPLIEAVLATTPDHVEVLVVDDGSPDGTGQRVDFLVKQNPRLHVLHREKKMGLGTAYLNGFTWGLQKSFTAFIEMDADFSHHPKYLPRMLELLEQNQVVIGSRYVPGGGTVNWGIGRKLLSRGGSIYSRLIIRDFTGGFNGWQREVLGKVDLPTLRSDGYSFQIELKYRAFLGGFKTIEFPIIFEDRKVGKSKMNRRIVFEALARVWGFRFNSYRQIRNDGPA